MDTLHSYVSQDRVGCAVVTNIPKFQWPRAIKVHLSLIHLYSTGFLEISCLLRAWGGEKLCLWAAMLANTFVH